MIDAESAFDDGRAAVTPEAGTVVTRHASRGSDELNVAVLQVRWASTAKSANGLRPKGLADGLPRVAVFGLQTQALVINATSQIVTHPARHRQRVALTFDTITDA